MPEELVTSALPQALLAHTGAAGAFRLGRVVLRQRLPRFARLPRVPALAKPTRRMPRQRAGRKPVVTAKTEELGPRERPVFRDMVDAQQSAATYFDYYNHQRRHSGLAYRAPQAFYPQQLKNTTLNSVA
jgi:hypothetical protein